MEGDAWSLSLGCILHQCLIFNAFVVSFLADTLGHLQHRPHLSPKGIGTGVTSNDGGCELHAAVETEAFFPVSSRRHWCQTLDG